MLREIAEIRGTRVADIGCGGGIYTLATAAMGASEVIGVDFSETMLEAARETCKGWDHVRFAAGDALHTGLPENRFDRVLQRALIHHLRDVAAGFREAFRILRPGGVLIVQDRTPSDVLLPPGPHHIRGYIFERFPRLVKTEIARRHDEGTVRQALTAAGFVKIGEHKFWETRKVHNNLHALEEDWLHRTGRSILHELTDRELRQLVFHVRCRLKESGAVPPIVDQDRWTVWSARKPM